MSRSIRRHQQAVARIRKSRILSTRGAYWYWPECKFWKPINRSMMNEPGWWVHEWMTVPARRKQARIERAIVRGLDPEGVSWPDNRKPHKYYW